MTKQNIFLYILALVPFLCIQSIFSFPTEIVDFNNALLVAHDLCESKYLDVMTTNRDFSDAAYAYDKRLIFTSEYDWDFGRNGVAFISLIDFLEKQEGQDAEEMLSSLNDLFYLLFHRHLSYMDIAREKQVQMVHALHLLSNFKNSAGKHALRSSLTRMFIYTLMVEVLGLHYHQKKEILFFAYEDFRASMRRIVGESADVAEARSEIDSLVNNLAAYGMREPIVKPRNIKRYVIWFIVGATLAGIVIYACKKIGTWAHFKAIVDDLVGSATKTFSETLMKNFSEPTAKAMIAEMKANSEALGAGMAKGMAEGLAYEDIDEPEVDLKKKRPNRKTVVIGNGLASGLAEGLAYEDVDAPEVDLKKKRPNKKTELLAQNLGIDLGKGIETRAARLANELTRGFVEEQPEDSDDEDAAGKKPAKRPARQNPHTRKLARIVVDELEDGAYGLKDELVEALDDVLDDRLERLEGTVIGVRAFALPGTKATRKAQAEALKAKRKTDAAAEKARRDTARKARDAKEEERGAQEEAEQAEGLARSKGKMCKAAVPAPKKARPARAARKTAPVEDNEEDADEPAVPVRSKGRGRKAPQDISWRAEIPEAEHADYEQYLYDQWRDEEEAEEAPKPAPRRRGGPRVPPAPKPPVPIVIPVQPLPVGGAVNDGNPLPNLNPLPNQGGQGVGSDGQGLDFDNAGGHHGPADPRNGDRPRAQGGGFSYLKPWTWGR
jgi:hypothetical protein